MTQKFKKKKKFAVTTQNCFKKTLMVELYVHCNLKGITHQQIFSQLEFFFFFSSTQKLFLIRLSLELWNPISFQPHMPPFYHFLF